MGQSLEKKKMKIITPYEKGTLVRNVKKYTTAENATVAISKLVRVKPEHIHHVESEASGQKLLACRMHPLVEAANVAFYDHLPLVLTPDVIWYCISNAVAIYINKNDEEMRKTFVSHEGKKELEVIKLDFMLGQANPWHEAIEELVGKIKENTNVDIATRLQANFSTTTKVSRVVSDIVIMDAMKKYFDYSVRGGCGIPEIRLAGEKSDWERVQAKANQLVEVIPKFKEWIPSVCEVIQHFIDAYEDKIDNKFWKSIYHYEGLSSAKGITGWLTCFFPFITDGEQNPYCWNGNTWRSVMDDTGLFESHLDYHLNQVPFKFKFGNSDLFVDMLFVGGLIGATLSSSDDFAVTPVFGYAVTEDKIINKQRF